MFGWVAPTAAWLVAVIDLSISDMLSIVCTIAFPAHRMWKHRGKEGARAELLIADLLRGAALSTFIIVIAMAVSRQFMNSAYDHNRVVLFLAGVIGAATVIKADKWMVEFFKQPTDSHKVEKPKNA